MILFFGCWTDLGHYLWTPERSRARFGPPGLGVFGWETAVPWGHHLDGGLAPLDERGARLAEGVVAVHKATMYVRTPREVTWTALSWWDRSVDKRPGSSATFLTDEELPDVELLARAKLYFPSVFARFGYPIVLP